MASSLTLEGKIAFITGSTRGIGWATACALAARKATVVINGHSDEYLLQDRVAQIRSEYGVESFGILADAGDPSQAKSCYQTIFKRYKKLDVLVNNAGILDDYLLGMIPDAIIEKTFAINTIGYIQHLQGAARLMARNQSGSIINVASIIGIRGNSGQVVYGASKAAVIGLTLSASKELAEKNIRVNAVAPGLIETDMIKQLDKEKLESLMASIQMGHIGKPEDVANVILFLASDLSSYVTGQVITVDGGMII
jgi:3-oxoacyl-[acyl-carrier protein] reductase